MRQQTQSIALALNLQLKIIMDLSQKHAQLEIKSIWSVGGLKGKSRDYSIPNSSFSVSDLVPVSRSLSLSD
jgi:hypothetical protein